MSTPTIQTKSDTKKAISLFSQWDRTFRTPDCPYCNGTNHAGGHLDDPNECGFCH